MRPKNGLFKWPVPHLVCNKAEGTLVSYHRCVAAQPSSGTTIIWEAGLMLTTPRHLFRKELLVMHRDLFRMLWLLIVWLSLLGLAGCQDRPARALDRAKSAWSHSRYLVIEVYEHPYESYSDDYVSLDDISGSDGTVEGPAPSRTYAISDRKVICELSECLRGGREIPGALSLAPRVTLRVFAVGLDSSAVILRDGATAVVQTTAGSKEVVAVDFDDKKALFDRLLAITKDKEMEGVTQLNR